MQRFYWLTLALLTFPLAAQSQNAWINEFHYDNVGTDVGEFVEVVVEDIVTNLPADFVVTLYNGSGGASYDSINLGAECTQGVTVDDFVWFDCQLPSNGIQNGSPDGLALSYQGTLIAGHFLSYEGTFTAVGGPADGVLSVDIGVSENGSEPVGLSLQLIGAGDEYADFVWSGPSVDSPGAVNTNQAISSLDLSVTCTFTGLPTAGAGGGGSDIPSEGGNYFYTFAVTNNGAEAATFDVWIDIDGSGVDLTFGPYATRTLGAGASLSRPFQKTVPGSAPGGTYTHTCHAGPFAASAASESFTFTKDPPMTEAPSDNVAWENDSELGLDSFVTSAQETETPSTHALEAAYPNPFNPEATFRFSVATQQHVRAELLDGLGRVVATLFLGTVDAGASQLVRIDGSALPSGTYVIRMTGETFNDARSITLLK